MNEAGATVGSAGKSLLWLVLAFVVIRMLAIGALLVSHQHQPESILGGDVNRYSQIADAHGIPYKDFQVEFPPATYALLRATTLDDPLLSIGALALASFVFDVGAAAILARTWSKRTAVIYLGLGMPMILFPFVYLRIDLFSMFLVVAGLALVRKRHDTAGGVALAIAVLAKIWPFAIAPILIVERRIKGVIAIAASGVAMIGSWLAIAGPSGVQEVVSFRDATGWQIESLPGIFWHMRDPSLMKYESGAFRTGVVPEWARPSLTLLSLAFIVLAWLWAWRRRREGADDTVVYGLAPLTCVLALLIFAPILSPQYIVWMLPLAAIIAARGDREIGWLTLAVTAITVYTYTVIGGQQEGNLYATIPVVVRNALLVVLFVRALQSLAGVRRPSLVNDQSEADASTPIPRT